MSRRPEHLRALPSPPSVAGKPPPHNLELEAVTLSACLLEVACVGPDGEAIAGSYARISDLLTARDFYSEANGWIWSAIAACAEAGPIDIALVAAWLHDRGKLDVCGGRAYLAQIVDATPSVANVPHHAMILARLGRRRRVIAELQQAAAEGYGDVGDEDEWVDDVAARLARRSQEARASAGVHVSDAMRSAVESVEAGPASIAAGAISTGLRTLDAATVGGLHRRELTLVSGITGHGKSAFAAGVEVAVAQARHSVVVFQLEDSKENLSLRMACQQARVDSTRVRNGSAGGLERSRLYAAADWIARLPLVIDDTKGLTVAGIKSRATRYAAELEKRHGSRLGLVVVDYLQLVRTASEDEDLRVHELAKVSEALLHMAEALDVPVLALSQLNEDGKIAESRAILNHAQNWINLERDLKRRADDTGADTARAVVRKQRHGPFPVTVPLWFHRAIVTFADDERLEQREMTYGRQDT